MREGNWMFVEYYDEDKVELYDLKTDAGEQRDLAGQEPAPVANMRAALAAWRKSINAQTNAPNPSFDATKYRDLYIDVDASKFDPLHASQADWEKMWRWRKEMNEVASPKSKKD